MTDSTDRICKCSDHYEIEMQTNSDCIEFVCAECKEVAADAKRAEQKDERAEQKDEKP